MEKIEITLTVNEWNVVMSSLGKMPFEQVVSVIGQIKEQAEAQIASPPTSEQQPS
jgi:hypothetical protein